MSCSLSSKQKTFLFLLALLLVLTLIGRISYSKHFHGLLCAARTFQHYASSSRIVDDSVGLVTSSSSNDLHDADKITEIRNRLKQQKILEEEAALKNGIVSRQMAKKMKNNKKMSVDKGLKQALPQALVIGVRKCGTRALLEMLEMHPRIAACGPEVHFFDKYYDRGLEWYRRQMQPSSPGQIAIEKTPSYYITEVAPERIYAMNKNIKLLVIVRDPTTRVISDFTQIASKGTSKMANRTFEDRVINSNGEIETSYKAIQISIYSQYLNWWLEFFPINQMHFVDGDKLITDPLPEMKKVERFLGLPEYISEDTFYLNNQTGFYCLASEKNSKCLSASKGREHPKVSDDVVKKLQDFYRPYNERFFKAIGHRFNWP